MVSSTRIVLVGEHDERAPLVDVVEDLPRFEIVGQASSADEAEELIKRQEPDLAVMDLTIGADDGIQLARRLKGLRPSMSLVVLSGLSQSLFAELALQAGASAYVDKSDPQALVRALGAVLEGHVHLSDDLLDHLSPNVDDADLNSDEAEVVRAYSRGAGTIGEVADQLDSSRREVVDIELGLMRKLGLHSRVGIRLYAQTSQD